MHNTHLSILSILAAAALGNGLRAAEIPDPPAPAWSVLPGFTVASDAEAQRLFAPMDGSLPVTTGGAGARRFARLTGNYRDTTHERCSWDLRLEADLAVARGVQFLFYSADSSPVSHYSMYLHSGDGWYRASFSPTRSGVWERVVVDKSTAGIEGTPGGWGAVDTIRISAWRSRSDRDTHFGLADLGAVGSDSPILVLRADSAAAGNEGRSIASFAGAVSRCLDELGLEPAVVSDLDLTAARLAGRRLLVLPYNPSLPEGVPELLRDFTAAGGFLLTFYSLPDPLAELMGLRRGEWVRPREGNFQGLVRVGEGLPGQPAVVGQASWNTQLAYPLPGKGRTLAVWRSATGADTDLPALVLGERGLHLGHVLLTDDWAGKRRLLLAAVGSLLPDAWGQAAGRALGQVGVFGSHAGLEELRRELAGADTPAASREALGRAEDGLAAARQALAGKRFPEAIELAHAAASSAIEAWCRRQAPLPGEHRAFWCHSAFGLPGKTWDEAIGLLAANGFNAILPNLLWGGTAYYPSTVLPTYAEIGTRGDQVQLCLDACRRHGVQCHVWKVNWNMGSHANPAFVQAMREAGRVQKSFDGTVEERWLCPSHPANQALEIDSMVELARLYPLDGIHFDYIRFPGSQHCFCEGCRSRFEAHLGRPVANWPGDVRSDKALAEGWLEWRREQITAVVRAVAEGSRAARPGIRVSAAVFRNWPLDRDHVGQDWKVWCEKGYLDFVCPMDYTESNTSFANAVRGQLEWSAGRPCYPGIGLSTWADPCDAVKLVEQILITRELRTGGFTVFNFGGNVEEVLPYCRMGVTAAP
ncbi:MAG: family 10 glycosylhydrolase [Lentisphaeria bacterium]|nr:family 10 glycosylhydrolase [Lentisphaeria bacterium]